MSQVSVWLRANTATAERLARAVGERSGLAVILRVATYELEMAEGRHNSCGAECRGCAFIEQLKVATASIPDSLVE